MKSHISYSELSLWYRDRNEYYRQYIEGIESVPNEGMKVGKIIHSVVDDPRYDWLKELRLMGYNHSQIAPIREAITKLMTKRAPEREVCYRATMKDGTKLFCIFDGLGKPDRKLFEYKTSVESQEYWTQKYVDYHKQLSFYAFAYWLNTHHFFKEINLYYADLAKGNVKTIETARGRRDIDFIQEWIEQGIGQIKSAGLWEKRLSRKEIAEKRNLKLTI